MKISIKFLQTAMRLCATTTAYVLIALAIQAACLIGVGDKPMTALTSFRSQDWSKGISWQAKSKLFLHQFSVHPAIVITEWHLPAELKFEDVPSYIPIVIETSHRELTVSGPTAGRSLGWPYAWIAYVEPSKNVRPFAHWRRLGIPAKHDLYIQFFSASLNFATLFSIIIVIRIIIIILVRLSRYRLGQCLVCGYRVGASGQCAECGQLNFSSPVDTCDQDP